MWCLGSFCNHSQIERIVVVSHEEVRRQIENEISEYRKGRSGADEMSIEVIGGGQTRQESVYKGLLHLSKTGERPDFVLVHDAARPFLTEKLISDTIASVIEHGACTVAVPVSDTVKRVDGNSVIETIDRSNLVAVHTPQGARFDWLLDAHETARSNNISATDDAFILEQSHEVKIVSGDRYNIKVTVPEDLLICEAICHMFIGQIMDVE